jgi:hypothetical protein
MLSSGKSRSMLLTGLFNPCATGSGGVQPVAAHHVDARIGQVLQELDEELEGGEQPSVRLEVGIIL